MAKGLKFAGRTTSRVGNKEFGGAALARGYGERSLALRIVLASLALLLLVGFSRAKFGDRPPLQQSLQPVWIAGPNLPNFQARGQLRSVPVSWLDTVAALPVFLAEITQEADPQEVGVRGAVWVVALVFGIFVAWFVLAQLGEWRAPSLPWALLLTLQGFGALYYLSSFRTPPLRLETPFTAFDFHTHTTRSSGLLTPQQQINWHRARGFKGLAFTDSDRLMPDAELAALRLANPDMMLINGCEYHGRDGHLLFFGLKTPISSKTMNVKQAVQAGKQQGAIVLVAHPWFPHQYSPDEFLTLGVDGFEAWNGQIWDRDLAEEGKNQQLIETSGTDTLSKSGSRCYTWTLIPRGIDQPAKVLRSLTLHKTAIAFALKAQDTPQAFETRRQSGRSPRIIATAIAGAWGTLAKAQKVNVLLGLVVVVALLWAWGAEGARKTQAPIGPNSALGFLRRRRLGSRLGGLLLMALAFAGSVEAAVVTMSGVYKDVPLVQRLALNPLHALIAWILLDIGFFYGRMWWQRTH